MGLADGGGGGGGGGDGGGGGVGGGGGGGGGGAQMHAQFMNREERAARRCRAEWPVRLAAPVAALLAATAVPPDAYHTWLTARGLVLPTPAAVAEAAEREKREVANVNAAALQRSPRGAVSRAGAGRGERHRLLLARPTVLWDRVRSALTAGHIRRTDLE